MVTPSTPSPVGEVDVRRLRSAIEFALLMVREARKTRPGLKYPSALDRYARVDRVPNTSLNAVRRILDADDDFRQRLGAVVTADLVDEVGRLWLQRPQGWETAIADAVAAATAAEDEADLAARLKRAEKRKHAAERTAARHAAELAGRDQRIEGLQAELEAERARNDALTAAVAHAEAALGEAKTEARHARDKMRAAEARLVRAQAERADSARPAEANDPVEPTGADSTGDGAAPANGVDREAVAVVAGELAALGRRLAELSEVDERAERDERAINTSVPGSATSRVSTSGRRRRRQRLAMPPGVLSESAEGTRFLLGSGAPILVDGYNVTKLAWPGLSLIAQRDRLIDEVELFAARQRADVTIVFDGSDVIGAHAGRRRQVRVLYSAADELADDVIRAEVDRLPRDRSVVVVTNDREIIDDVAAMGANVVSSSSFVDALG